jgi:hypothetical protein
VTSRVLVCFSELLCVGYVAHLRHVVCESVGVQTVFQPGGRSHQLLPWLFCFDEPVFKKGSATSATVEKRLALGIRDGGTPRAGCTICFKMESTEVRESALHVRPFANDAKIVPHVGNLAEGDTHTHTHTHTHIHTCTHTCTHKCTQAKTRTHLGENVP